MVKDGKHRSPVTGHRSRLVAAAVLALLLAGCANIEYYLNSMSGQFDIWRRERPIDELLANAEITEPLKKRLGTVLQIREFASRELSLPDNRSYRTYADLERPFVVWNVFAAPEFSVRPVKWCFALVGCVNYRGYFSAGEAGRYAAELSAGGYDVHVGGIAAYSTLGWFADPILNTVIHYSTPRLARLVFHELAHQVVFARGDTVFNESFAVAVEREGVRRWLQRYGSPRDQADFDRGAGRREDFLALVMAYHGKLDTLYRSGVERDEMRAAKRRLFADMDQEYRQLKVKWGGFSGYDRWFGRGVNNAQVASIAVYTQMVPAFEALLAQSGGDLPEFYRRVIELSKVPKAERNRILAALAVQVAGTERRRN
jgi:predicted aminopeptidase